MTCVLSVASQSDEETRAIGRQIASILPAQAVVILTGELGAGKTTITQGIVEGLGAAPAAQVSSPTFTLIQEYGDPVRVYHVDLYRLDTAEQARRLGLDDLFAAPALVLIEWGNRFLELLPHDRYELLLSYEKTDGARHIKLLQCGDSV